MGPETLKKALPNSAPTANNRAQHRMLKHKKIGHYYRPMSPLNMGIQGFKKAVAAVDLRKGVRTQLIKRYKERAYADLKEMQDAAPTKEEIILSQPKVDGDVSRKQSSGK